ncbi:molybdopterin molybdotransferase MoeA [Alteriqipengyuania lutimaris]|uniref:Molybdopterin molybdenumtransferase n=1 Tax=Alteriqipengyuania lutimaris TaxID=1538146 RepID=A0A395LUG6_9SPHN|nr:molybdopterin molybdotransferase MoeA [Alteriqipengyuania lutimaris]MBB3032813.1 molybdopterin molybdotransferase [Alteriqipengyuania lutimaris]RDS78090.1 molybdopterin molybdenumtransferase MoeA [Alteriqipengyuania lutimaris]
MTPPIDLEQAQARLLAMLRSGPAIACPVGEAGGRFLAKPAIARRNNPPKDLSAMDGYATIGDGPWELVGEARAGLPFAKALSTGMAVRISTGAHMPTCADAVLIQENARVEGDTLFAEEAPDPNFIRRAGLDFEANDVLIEPGGPLGAAQMALARAGGLAKIVVHEVPQVAVVEVGDELCADPSICAPTQIPAVNGAMLASMARGAGADVSPHGPVADDADALVETLWEARDAALIVISGGASVGPHDLVKPALEAAGFTIDFWRVAIKPGKPLLVARRGNTVALGLPGNPVSSFVTGFLFMAPAIRKLAGAAACLPRAVPLPLAAPLPAGGKRREFLRATWTDAGVIAAEVQDSSALLPLARADVLIDRPAGADRSDTGAFVPCYLLENRAYA